jgi:hypothetical protein
MSASLVLPKTVMRSTLPLSTNAGASTRKKITNTTAAPIVTMPLAIANLPAVVWSTVTRESCSPTNTGSMHFRGRDSANAGPRCSLACYRAWDR